MKYLFTPEGEHALQALHATATLYAFDFDGTLAPIVPMPAHARAPAGVVRLLRRLAAMRPVAVISGRSLRDLAGRVPDNLTYLVGNHGNEGIGEPAELETMRTIVAGWIAQLHEMLGPHPQRTGLLIENKEVSVSVHYRLARDRAQAESSLAEQLQRLAPPPRVIGGKLVFNLLPPGGRTKFEALAHLAERCAARSVVFAGDDVTDEYVFAQAPASWLTVRVELQRDSRAAYFVHRQAEIALLLEVLLRHAQAASAS